MKIVCFDDKKSDDANAGKINKAILPGYILRTIIVTSIVTEYLEN